MAVDESIGQLNEKWRRVSHVKVVWRLLLERPHTELKLRIDVPHNLLTLLVEEHTIQCLLLTVSVAQVCDLVIVLRLPWDSCLILDETLHNAIFGTELEHELGWIVIEAKIDVSLRCLIHVKRRRGHHPLALG